MQSQSENGEHPALLIVLVLENIFTNLELKHLIPLRLVCRKWSEEIVKHISKYKQAIFSYTSNQRIIGDVPESVFYFQNFKITNLEFQNDSLGHGPEIEKKEDKKLDTIYLEALEKFGSQVKKLNFTCLITAKEDLVFLKTILTLTPNLEYLVIYFKDMENYGEVFNDFCHKKVRFLFLHSFFVGDNSAKFVETMLKCFPNLEIPFCLNGKDTTLRDMIVGKKTSIKMRKFGENFENADKVIKTFDFLIQLSPQIHALTRLGFRNITEIDPNKAQMVFKILNNFASTLKSVHLTLGKECKEVEVSLPPLPHLRKLFLGTICNEPVRFNMGKKIDKDYPLLEYFTFKPNYVGDKNVNSEELWTSCKPWVPIVPYGNEGFMAEFDLSPLKFLKFVDLNIPIEWTLKEENREWCETFVDVYLQIYGNGGRGTIQHVIDWVM